MQLEHNVQEYSDLLNSDNLDDKADESPERAILRHARHQSPAIADTGHIGTGHTRSTGNTGHTGQHRSKRQHSVHQTHLVRSDADDHRSTLINRTLQQHRLDLEYRSAADRSRHRSRSSRKDSGTHRATISLRHADPGELSPAEMLRHRRVRSRSRSYDSVSPRRHSRSPSRSRGKKKKSHKKRKHSSTSSSSRRRSSSSSRERSKHRHIYKKKKKHTNSHSSKRDKHVKKHKRKRSPSPSPSSSSSVVSSSYYSSSRQRSPARKRSRTTNSVAKSNLLPAASKSAAGRGSRQSSFEGGSGGNNSRMSRLLLPNFPSSQEERETQADHRPLCAQPFCLHRDIQNGDTEKSEKCRSAERLGVFIGSDGRLFAYPNTSSVSQIPQIHVERSSVPVQGTPIRPLDKSFSVYTPYDCHSDIPKEKGYNSTSLCRRLVSSKPKPSKTVGTQTIHYVADQLTRSDNQLREIRPSSSSSVHFHRDGVSDPYQYRQSTSSQANEDIGFSQNILTENLCISQRFPVPLGTTERCSRLCNVGTVTSPTITNVSAQSVAITEISVVSPDWYNIENSATPQIVASGRSVSSWDPHEDSSSLPHHLYRRQPVRLGSSCGTGGTSVSWTMDRRPIPAPYQCARDESNFSLSNTSGSQGKEFHCIGVNGQHYSGSLYKASGRDSIHSSLRGGVEHPEFVPSSQHTAVSEAHTGQVQHSSRPDVSNRQTDLHRVVPESGNSKQDFPDHGLSINRPVCHTSEPQAATICVTHTGSEGAINRCHLDGLESHTRLCVSTVPSHSNCDKQSTDIPVQNSIDCSFMARQTMVSRAPRSVGVSTGISTSNAKSACSAKRQNSASKPGSSTTSRLGIVKQSLRDKQFSSEVAEHVSKAQRDSTVKSMMQNGKSSVIGQINGRLILSRPLPR